MTNEDDEAPYILVLGTADWNQPIATNQHYIVRELLRDGFARVTFVESLALRRPQFRPRDLRRIMWRVAAAVSTRDHRSTPSREWRARPVGLDVRSPLVIPDHSGPFYGINRRLLRRSVRDWVGYSGPKLLWAYTPTTYGLERETSAVVYHCVDLLGKVPGISETIINRAEQRLCRQGVRAVATSRVVKEHLEGVGFTSVQLWENVADTEVISAAVTASAMRRPGRVIFAGNLSPTKIDYELLEALASRGLDVVIAGPRAEGGGHDADAFRSLLAHGVSYLGMLSIRDLANELAQAAVGIIPYVINDYTLGVSPLKTFEYLAAGLPVVSTALPGVTPDHEDLFVEQDHQSFIHRVVQLADSHCSEAITRRTSKAVVHSWTRRGEEARDLARRAHSK